uniref:E3 SUMO-protein ligase NSE2 n=1 Tax=Astyanax mexicanus TaxID=7994 RepID=A0A8B9JXK0_ASTMX
MSLSSVQPALSSLKTCQVDIGTGMDIVSDVALDLVEAQVNQSAAAHVEEELDEDIAVTQSQTNFTCPLTQVEMVNPVRNKKCQHYYDQEAALTMIKTRHNNKKKFRCPVVGCSNSDVKQSDLELDLVMKRLIQTNKRQSGKS